MRLMELVTSLELRPLHSLSAAEQLQILAIRNQPEVRRNMYTCHEISEAEHFRWIERLKADNSTQFSAVFLKGLLIGGVSLNSISNAHRRADWAFYLSADAQGQGTGSALEFKYLDHAFEHVELQKLNCEVFAFNEAVISLHKKFGFIEEGIRRAHILRDGEALDVYFLGITRDEWHARRDELTQRLFA